MFFLMVIYYVEEIVYMHSCVCVSAVWDSDPALHSAVVPSRRRQVDSFKNGALTGTYLSGSL